jgi:hypothetical protein
MGWLVAHMIWPGTTSNGLGPARITSRAVLGPSRQLIGRARHDLFSSARLGPVVGPFNPVRHDATRKLNDVNLFLFQYL